MRVPSHQRPEIRFFAALLLLGLVFFVRSVGSQAPSPTVAALTAPLPPTLAQTASGQEISAMQTRIRTNPADADAYARLGLALLEQVRETADPAAYRQAEQAFAEALKRDSRHLDALIGQGVLALANHDFAAALSWGEQAQAVNPARAQVYGIIADAQLELGQYDAAGASLETMIATRPDLSSYSRVSYFRELHGDAPGAIEIMRLAAESGGPRGENTAWTYVQLGNLYFNIGDVAAAEREYAYALALVPNFVHAHAALAKVAAARGDFVAARQQYAAVTARMPLAEYVVAAGELELAAGDPAAAQKHFDLVAAIDRLNQANGMQTDLEMALFLANHGDPQVALERARTAYTQRPGIYGAATLAWALSQAGRHAEAQPMIDTALQLGTQDALLFYHAGVIAHRNGDSIQAKRWLEAALAVNPFFSALDAPQARQLLADITQ